MITAGMTSKEKYDHLCEDLEKIRYRMTYYRPKAIKEFKNSYTFPAWKTYDYTVQKSNNKYVLVYYVENQFQINNPKEIFFLDYYDGKEHDVVRWVAQAYRQTPDSPLKLVRVLHVFDSHFLQRYKERFLKDMTLNANEVASRFLSRNDVMVQIDVSEEINRSIEKYGELGKWGYKVKDGMCYAKTVFEGIESEDGDVKKNKVDAICILFKTFVTESIMSDNQNYAIRRETWEKWNKSYIDFLKENNGEDITLGLEP